MAVEEFKTTYTLTNERRNHLRILINESQSAVDNGVSGANFSKAYDYLSSTVPSSSIMDETG